jgi:hypothetical protein
LKSSIAEIPSTSDKSEDIEKLPLFRCIYLDPDTGYVSSIGHREEYLFYQDKKGEEEIESITKEYNKTLNKVRQGLNKLQAKIKKYDLNPEIVGKLLINLRYLTKHVAFKEEQECRIIKIKPLGDGEIKTGGNHDKMYIEYIDINNHVKKIYCAPRIAGFELYRDILKHELEIECVKSKQPFA